MLRLYKYQRYFKRPFRTSTSEFHKREGIILTFEKKNIKAFGEIAPLPGFSEESLNDVLRILKFNKKYLEAALFNDEAEPFLSALNSIHNFPSLSFGIDTLIHDLKAKKEGVPFHKLLLATSPDKIKSNATVGMGTIEGTLSEIESCIQSGFDTIKIKIGTNFDQDFVLLKTIRQHFPDIHIRIDANQSWEKTNAITNLNSLSEFDIEYCEQPVASNLYHEMAEIKATSPIKIAADESVRNLKDINTIIQQKAADIIIIKPMLFGGFDQIITAIKLAHSHYIDVVLTTAMEEIIGRTVTATLAACFGSKKYAQGLATGNLFTGPHLSLRELKDGYYCLSNAAGLDIDLNYIHLEEITD